MDKILTIVLIITGVVYFLVSIGICFSPIWFYRTNLLEQRLSAEHRNILSSARSAITGLLIKIQLVIYAFLSLGSIVGCVCLYSVLKLSTLSSISKLDFDFDAKGGQLVSETCLTLLEPILWGIIAFVAISFIVIFVQKVIKFLIIQCDIISVWVRLSSRIVLDENVRVNQVVDEFEELSQQILRKNQSGFLNNIFAGISI